MYSISATGIPEKIGSPKRNQKSCRKELPIEPNCHWRYFLVKRAKMQKSGKSPNVGIGCGFSPSCRGNSDGFVVAKLVMHHFNS
jgi:hypothetical protein